MKESRYITFDAFLPDVRTSQFRDDLGLETSINWEDHAGVVQLTLADRSIAEFGAARIQLMEIHRVASGVQRVPLALKCERKELDNNPHHGNIVFSKLLANIQQKQLASALALKSQYISPAP